MEPKLEFALTSWCVICRKFVLVPCERGEFTNSKKPS